MTALRRLGGLGLRGRLVGFVIGITIVPLAAAVLALQLQIDALLEERTEHELATARAAAVAVVDGEAGRAADLADDLADQARAALAGGTLSPDLDDGDFDAWFADAVGDAVPSRADHAVLVDADGGVLALEAREPAFRTEVDPAELLGAAVVSPDRAAGVLLETRELRVLQDGQEEQIGWVAAGLWLDAQLLDQLRVRGGAAFLADAEVLAAIGARGEDLPVARLPPPGTVDTLEVGDDRVTASVAPLAEDGPTALGVWTPRTPRANTLAVGGLVLVPSVLLAGLLGWLLAMAVVAPIRQAADAARAIAAGDLSRSLEPSGGPELADLATALNTMKDELARRLEELSQSRDRLRGSLDRLGLMLSSSLDLNRTLAVVVETAKDTLVADRALLLLYTPERDALYCKVARGAAPPPALDAGEGVIGHVAREAVPLLIAPDGTQESPRHIDGEPRGVSQLAVPLLGRGRVLGVMTLLRDDPDQPFSRGDLDTIRSFAAQASVAIDNVLLHQEARRLSVTDTLTGLWNFRYFQLQAEREIESATRFERPMSLAIIDIDHFKAVNDEHGHQVGDVVLAEVARRIRGATRAPDVVARYGGEEFVVLLPGTDLRGAVATAERIRRAVATDPVDVRGTPVPVSGAEIRSGPESLEVTCSAGVAAFPRHGQTVGTLLRTADAAMYAAKRQGRNRVVGARLDPPGERREDRDEEVSG